MVKDDEMPHVPYNDFYGPPPDEEYVLEEGPFFTGCSCEHDPAQHSYEKCDECDCEGHWEY